MSDLRQQFKRIIPPSAWRAGSGLWYAGQRALQWPAAAFHPLRRASIQRLGDFKDIHRSQRAFIIGNGPSLKQTDLSKLKGEFTFGMNRFYLSYPELGFHSTYYVSINSLVIEQCAEDIRALPMPRFLSWRSHPFIQPNNLRPTPACSSCTPPTPGPSSPVMCAAGCGKAPRSPTWRCSSPSTWASSRSC